MRRRTPARGRRREHQRRFFEPVLLSAATWRLEEFRPGVPVGRSAGHPQVLPPAGHHRVPRAQVGEPIALVPLLASARTYRWRVAAPLRGPRCAAATTTGRLTLQSLVGCLRDEVEVGK